MKENLVSTERMISQSAITSVFRLRAFLASNKELADKLVEMEAKYDGQFNVVFDALRELMASNALPRILIGFNRKED